MGLWEAMRGKTQPKQNNLDALFHVPSAAITLQTALGFEPTGTGSVCYRSATGAAFARRSRCGVAATSPVIFCSAEARAAGFIVR